MERKDPSLTVGGVQSNTAIVEVGLEILKHLKYNHRQVWWLMPLIPALERQREVYLCDFQDFLVDKVSSRTGRAL